MTHVYLVLGKYFNTKIHMGIWYFTPLLSADIRDLLHWLPVQRRIEHKLCLLVYKCLHQLAPIYISELCIPVAATATRSHLRSAVRGNLVISYSRTKRYGQRSFAYSGPAL